MTEILAGRSAQLRRPPPDGADMTPHPRSRTAVAGLAGLALVLSACGGGGGSEEDSAASDPLREEVAALSERVDELSGLDARLDRLEEAVAEPAEDEEVADGVATADPAVPGDHAADAEEDEAAAHEAPHWGYADADHWGELAEEFATCGSGTEQSPIDLTKPVATTVDDAVVAYQASAATVTDNGHTVQVSFTDGGTATVDGHEYGLLQFHFHAPSEHTVDGEHAPVEAHFVHADAEGNLAVIGVMIVEGEADPLFDEILATVPATGEVVDLPTAVDAAALLPENLMAYRYRGSLTTPPCSEGVTWSVLQQPLAWSAEQIAMLESHLAEANNRPVQPLNARTLRLDVAAG
jgi:carbonic anhydrase